jgi:DNA-binding NarL/FixJ family response regulator
MKRAAILLVSDDETLTRETEMRIDALGHAVAAAVATPEDALRRVMEPGIDLALVQIDLRPGRSGIEAASYISHVFNTPVVFIVRGGGEGLISLSQVSAPAGYLHLPCSDTLFRENIERAIASDQIFAGKAKGPRSVGNPHTG